MRWTTTADLLFQRHWLLVVISMKLLFWHNQRLYQETWYSISLSSSFRKKKGREGEGRAVVFMFIQALDLCKFHHKIQWFLPKRVERRRRSMMRTSFILTRYRRYILSNSFLKLKKIYKRERERERKTNGRAGGGEDEFTLSLSFGLMKTSQIK